jgi:hypothetical protein
MVASPQVLLVGSVPLSSNEETFRSIAKALPTQLKRIPDGETGHRSNFIAWQHPVFPINVVQPRWGGQPPKEKPNFKYAASDLKPTGYDDAAISSYAVFERLQGESVIPSNVRFQVGLPTPATAVRGFVETDYCAEIEPLYEERLLQAAKRIQGEIPHSKLTLQWDLPFEIGMLEVERGRLSEPLNGPYFSDVQSGIIERLARLAQSVASDVEMGFHICYGDMGHVHFVEPDNIGLMVSLANEIHRRISPIHPISYIHMPVPKGRTDDAYFKPLQSLAIDHETQLYLGVVHPGDEDGTKARLEAAKKVYSGGIGVASECGLGRTPREELESILAISAIVVSLH